MSMPTGEKEAARDRDRFHGLIDRPCTNRLDLYGEHHLWMMPATAPATDAGDDFEETFRRWISDDCGAVSCEFD